MRANKSRAMIQSRGRMQVGGSIRTRIDHATSKAGDGRVTSTSQRRVGRGRALPRRPLLAAAHPAVPRAAPAAPAAPTARGEAAVAAHRSRAPASSCARRPRSRRRSGSRGWSSGRRLGRRCRDGWLRADPRRRRAIGSCGDLRRQRSRRGRCGAIRDRGGAQADHAAADTGDADAEDEEHGVERVVRAPPWRSEGVRVERLWGRAVHRRQRRARPDRGAASACSSRGRTSAGCPSPPQMEHAIVASERSPPWEHVPKETGMGCSSHGAGGRGVR